MKNFLNSMLLSILLTIPTVHAYSLDQTPLISGTEYILRIEGDKTKLDWNTHFINKGNQTLYGLGISFDYEINVFFENKKLECDTKIVTDSNGKINEYPFLYRGNKSYFAHYVGVGGELKPDNSFNILSTINCNGFITKKEQWNEVGWIFVKVPKTEELVIRYEIEKPLFKDVEIVQRFPPTSLVTSDSNIVAVEWHTQEDNLSPTLAYKYVWDSNSINLMIISGVIGFIIGFALDNMIRKIKLVIHRRRGKKGC